MPDKVPLQAGFSSHWNPGSAWASIAVKIFESASSLIPTIEDMPANAGSEVVDTAQAWQVSTYRSMSPGREIILQPRRRPGVVIDPVTRAAYSVFEARARQIPCERTCIITLHSISDRDGDNKTDTFNVMYDFPAIRRRRILS